MTLLLLLACAPKDADTASDTAAEETTDTTDDATTDGSRVSTTWFIGTGERSFADASPDVTYELLYQRRLEPGSGQIIEDTYEVIDGALTHQQVTAGVDGDTFTGAYTDEYGDLTVTGTLVGDPWTWFLWDAEATYTSGEREGATLTANVELHSRGLAAEETLTLSDGAEVHVDLAIADPVDEATFSARLEKLGG